MERSSKTVGVRELRQNLSKYLRRVLEGETLQVTDRGKPVAVLAPLPQPKTRLERLVASGAVVLPVEDWTTFEPPTGPISTELSDALREQRAERL
jgi:prevent-host-death family protein